MSTETRAALENALQAHVDDDRPGYFVSGYVLQAHLVPIEDDGRHHYFTMHAENQPYHSTYGLLQTAIDDFVVVDDE